MDNPNLIESVTPLSGEYSWKRDLRLNAWLGVAVTVYIATLFLNKHASWGPVTRGLVALTPLLPGLLYVRSWARFIRGMDELQQRVQLTAFLIATLGTIAVDIILTTLGESGVSLGGLAHGLGLGGVFIVMLPLWLVGGAVANCRYK